MSDLREATSERTRTTAQVMGRRLMLAVFGLGIAALTFVIGISLAGGRQSRAAVVRSWLLCDECTEGQLLKVLDLGEDAIPLLAAALRDGPSPGQIANIRSQSRSDAAAVARVAGTVGSATPPAGGGRAGGAVRGGVTSIDTADMFSRDIANYVDSYRERALIGLSTIGSQAARDTIRQLLVRDSTSAVGWSQRVRSAVLAHVLGVYNLRILPIEDIMVGQSRLARVRIFGQGQNPPLTWTSSNLEVATVTADGRVTGVKPGQAIVRACWSGPGVPPICAIRAVRVIA